VRTAS